MAIRREITLPVDREAAWRMLSDPEELASWLADEVELEIELGAQGWLRWESGECVQATVEEIAEHRRVVLRWASADAPETLVELTLDDVPEGTRLVVLELPVIQLEAVGALLEQGPSVIEGPRMLAAVA
jgi:uncharacterized protein YndB with AHSA1/START domain